MDNLAVNRTIDLRASVATGVRGMTRVRSTMKVKSPSRLTRTKVAIGETGTGAAGATRAEEAEKTAIAVRLRLILTLVALTGFCLVYTFMIADYTWADPVPDQISQYLLQEGCDVGDIHFVRVKYRVGHLPDIYQSSAPVRYEGRMTEFWEVRSVTQLVRTYHIILPYYGEAP